MSERAPLLDRDGLPLPRGALHDHPIFLRVCHSPWRFINQNTLCYLRGIILVYLLAVMGMLIDFKVNREDKHSGWRMIFEFDTITFGLIVLYHIMAFSWTLTHLHWPHIDESDQTWESRILRAMSPPDQPSYSRRRFYFSLFYSLVHVYSFMVTLIYWAVLVPQGHGHLPKHDGEPPKVGHNFLDHLFSEGWFKPFCLYNLYTMPSILAVFEILFLNSIKRQVPVPSHVFAIQFLAGLYLGWAAIGKMLTGHNPFFWMGHKGSGSREIVAAYCVGFVALAPGAFSFMYGLIGMRDAIVERGTEPEDIAAGLREEHGQQARR